MTLLPAQSTQVSADSARAVLGAAYATVAGMNAPETTLRLIVAQSALETAQWQKMFRWNWGNIRAGGSWSGDTQMLRGATEVIGGQEIVDEGPFRAYSSASEGAEDFVRLLLRDTATRRALASGDVGEYNEALKARGYYTAPKDRYLAALESNYLALFGGVPDSQKKKAQLSLLELLSEPPCSLGETGNDVLSLQELLNAFGVGNTLKTDGIWGAKTRQAWQAAVAMAWSRLKTLRAIE